MQDIPEDPESMGIPLEQMVSDRGKEEIGEKFKAQLPQIKQDLYAHPDADSEFLRTRDQNYEQVALDESRLFVHHKADWYGNEIEHDRSYFAYNPTAENFEEIANCNIQTKLFNKVEFSKVGRISGRYDKEIDSLIVYFDSETPSLSYSITIFSGEPVEEGRPKKTEIYQQFDYNQISWLQIDGPLADTDEEGNEPLFETPEEIEELAQKASLEGGFKLENEDGETWAVVTYKPAQRIFEIVFNDSQGQPAYLTTIPRDVDTQHVVDETSAKMLFENPESPTDIDEYWKRANFGELLGIKIEPVVG